MKTSFLLLLLGGLLIGPAAYAQTGSISGIVRDADGVSLPGATVQVVGLTQGTTTAADGRFELTDVPVGSQTVEARFVGFAPVRTTVTVRQGATTNLRLVLRDQAILIDGVTVTGAREQGYRAATALQVNRSSAPLKETPFSVQVVTADLIDDRGVTQFGEALRYVPGLTPRVGFSANNDRYNIRGFSTSYTYRNGFRRSGYSVGDQVANIQQVEILKGATSSLYGQAEPGGVVNVVTKQPEAEAFASVVASVGSFSSYRVSADANVPLSPTLGVRLNASYDDRDGYRDLTFAQDWFVAPVIAWQPSSRTRFVIEGEYGQLTSFPDRGFGSDTRFLAAPRERQFAGSDGELTRDGGLITAMLTHDIGEAITLRAAGSYSEFTIEALYYGYGFPALGEGTTNPDVTVRPTDSFDNQNNFVLQAEALGRFATGPARHTALVGVERGEDKWSYVFDIAPGVVVPFDNPVVPVPAQGPFDPFFEGRTNATTTAVYAQNETVLGPLRLLVGARYDQSYLLNRFFGDNEKEEGQLSPRAGLTWTPLPEVSLYANASRSFVPQAFPLKDGGISDAVRGRGLEAGGKFSLLGGRLAPTVAVFDITRFNVAQVDPDDPTFSQYILIGESRSRGVELDAPLAITPRWRAVATYAYLDAEITEDTNLEPGTPLINAPDHSAGLWTSYDLTGVLDGLTLGSGILHIGERAATSSGTLLIPAYTRLDASVVYTRSASFGTVRAQLSATNLADEFFYESGGGNFLPLHPAAPRAFRFLLGVTL
ncbi:MAG: TonB-dependent siderophore receptor [Rhodothermales bacterium]